MNAIDYIENNLGGEISYEEAGISLFLANEVIYETVMNAIALPVFFLSTALFPANSFFGGMAIVINLNPFTHVINALRTLILQGNIITKDILFGIPLLALVLYQLHMGAKEIEKRNKYIKPNPSCGKKHSYGG